MFKIVWKTQHLLQILSNQAVVSHGKNCNQQAVNEKKAISVHSAIVQSEYSFDYYE